jgi:hypothetical protein
MNQSHLQSRKTEDEILINKTTPDSQLESVSELASAELASEVQANEAGSELKAALRGNHWKMWSWLIGVQVLFGISVNLVSNNRLPWLSKLTETNAGALILVLFEIGIALASIAIVLSQSSKRGRKAVEELASNDDVNMIGPLLDARNLPDGKTRHKTTAELIQLLPRLRASDAELLTPAQHGKLRSLLNMSQTNVMNKDVWSLFGPANAQMVDLQIAILKAFEQIGDEKALPIVERLADQQAKTAVQKRLKQAAIECLPSLQQRIELNETSKALLRPAESPISSEELLRPATHVGELVPDRLLRPVAEEPS